MTKKNLKKTTVNNTNLIKQIKKKKFTKNF